MNGEWLMYARCVAETRLGRRCRNPVIVGQPHTGDGRVQQRGHQIAQQKCAVHADARGVRATRVAV